MSSRTVAAVALKVLAIWLLVQFPLAALDVMKLISQPENESDLFYLMTSAGIVIALGLLIVIVIWKLANSVIESIPPGGDDLAIGEKILLQVLGSYFLVTALGEIIPALMYSYAVQDTAMSQYSYIAGRTIVLLVGFVLVVRPSLCAAGLRRFRS